MNNNTGQDCTLTHTHPSKHTHTHTHTPKPPPQTHIHTPKTASNTPTHPPKTAPNTKHTYPHTQTQPNTASHKAAVVIEQGSDRWLDLNHNHTPVLTYLVWRGDAKAMCVLLLGVTHKQTNRLSITLCLHSFPSRSWG